MFKLPRNRLWVGRTHLGAPCAFAAEHLVSLVQNPNAAHIVFVKLDSGETVIVEHPNGLKGVLEGLDIQTTMPDISNEEPLPRDLVKGDRPFPLERTSGTLEQ